MTKIANDGTPYLFLPKMGKIGRVQQFVNWEWEEELETLKIEHVAFCKY